MKIYRHKQTGEILFSDTEVKDENLVYVGEVDERRAFGRTDTGDTSEKKTGED